MIKLILNMFSQNIYRVHTFWQVFLSHCILKINDLVGACNEIRKTDSLSVWYVCTWNCSGIHVMVRLGEINQNTEIITLLTRRISRRIRDWHHCRLYECSSSYDQTHRELTPTITRIRTHTHTHTWLHKPCITTFNTSSAFHKNVWSTASLISSWDYIRWFMKRSRTVLIRPDQHFSNVSSSYNCKLWPTTLHFKHNSETVKTNQVPNIHQRSLRSKVIVQSHN